MKPLPFHKLGCRSPSCRLHQAPDSNSTTSCWIQYCYIHHQLPLMLHNKDSCLCWWPWSHLSWNRTFITIPVG